jgi:glycosyltransferase involved in cell wall biosynthesis
VIHPPVAIERFFRSQERTKGDYYLAAGAFVNYKRFDLAIAACEALGVKLKVIGDGPDEKRLRKLAGPYTEFILKPSGEEWVDLFQRARALIFPGVEDFGITAIEALDEGSTGVFFDHETVDSLIGAIKRFEASRFDGQTLKTSAQRFSKDAFLNKIRAELSALKDS